MFTKAIDKSTRLDSRIRSWVVLHLSALLLLTCSAVADVNPDIAVAYPLVREPFAALYRDYVFGIDEVASRPIREFPVNGDSSKLLSNMSNAGQPDVYIALGNKSVKIISDLNTKKPIVAVVTDTKYEADIAGGILLKPPADVYLSSLLDIYAPVEQVFVVYNPADDQRLVDDAEQFLRKRGIAIKLIPAKNIREAAAGYQSILNEAKAYSALWLLPDNNLLDKSLLSTVLDVAWEKKLIVFSSNPLFVKHGALFAIYPDNKGVGNTLGKIAKDIHNNKTPGLQPLRDVRLAVNQRTVNHLGIDLSPHVREKIELMLPGR